MSEEQSVQSRGYRRGAIMGLTMAEAFILIAFALLFLFAFWRLEVEKENTRNVVAFKELSPTRQAALIDSASDGSIDLLIDLKKSGVEVSPASIVAGTDKDKWRFIPKQDLQRLMDGASELPEDVQRKLAELVELQNAPEVLQQLGALEALIEAGQDVESILETAAAVDRFKGAGQTLDDISGIIRAAQAQEAALVLRSSGIPVSEVKIEGHASSEWSLGTTPEKAYLSNLDLSQQRSQVVLRECLSAVQNAELREWARGNLIAVGYSSARPVMTNGAEDKAASRRVVFSVTPNQESVIEDIQTEAIGSQKPDFDRSAFGGWADADSDCQNTRHELLVDRSDIKVTLSNSKCFVVSGSWLDPYSGETHSDAKEIEIDHLVPLKWAWDHGAADWSADKRGLFANDQDNLIAVSARINREKSASGPTDWLPPNEDFKCQYVTNFENLVQKYELEFSNLEKITVDKILDNCP